MTAIDLVLPDGLHDAPELALVAVLDAALQQTTYALFAIHPELTGIRALGECWSSGPDLWAADAVYDHITSLQHALERYRQAIAACRAGQEIEEDVA